MLLTKGLSPAVSGVGGRGWDKCRGARKRPWTARQPGGGRGWTEQCCGEGGGGAQELSISGYLEVVVPFLFPRGFRGLKGPPGTVGPASSDVSVVDLCHSAPQIWGLF